jgi:hypothetical protein
VAYFVVGGFFNLLMVRICTCYFGAGFKNPRWRLEHRWEEHWSDAWQPGRLQDCVWESGHSKAPATAKCTNSLTTARD